MNNLFCVSCGKDVVKINSLPKCDCEKNRIFSWITDETHIAHLFQGLNYMIVSDDCTVQSSSNNFICYEL